jgi:hypothetical protein
LRFAGRFEFHASLFDGVHPRRNLATSGRVLMRVIVAESTECNVEVGSCQRDVVVSEV